MKKNGLALFLSLTSTFFATSAAASGGRGALPIGWVDPDISNKLINLASIDDDGESSGVHFAPSNPQAGFRQIRSTSLNLELGVYGGWYLNGATFASTLFGAGAALMPVVGSTVVSTRTVSDLQEARTAPEMKIPADPAGLSGWKAHDSILYDTSGGVLFSVGVGYAFTGLSGDYLAKGDWSTYIEKIDATHVYVKNTSIQLRDFDLVAGNFVANVMLSKFNKADQMFSYTFDLSDTRAVAAYQAMIHGSQKEAQQLAETSPTLARLELTEAGRATGAQSRFFLGVPFLNASSTSGSLYDFSDTLHHADQSRSDVHYGLYWKEKDSDVLAHHRSATQAFYGIAYHDVGADNQGMHDGLYGKLILSQENDHADRRAVSRMLGKLVERTGLRQQLGIAGTLPEISGYLHLSLVMEIPESTTRELMAESRVLALEHVGSVDLVRSYFAQGSDSEKLCPDPDPRQHTRCTSFYEGETRAGVNEMQRALRAMADADRAHDQPGLVKAYARFGKAMLKNEFTFSLVLQLLKGSSFGLSLAGEGTSISSFSRFVVPFASMEATDQLMP